MQLLQEFSDVFGLLYDHGRVVAHVKNVAPVAIAVHIQHPVVAVTVSRDPDGIGDHVIKVKVAGTVESDGIQSIKKETAAELQQLPDVFRYMSGTELFGDVVDF